MEGHGRLGTRAALVATLGVLAGYHELRRLAIPNNIHFATNTAMIGVVGGIAVASALSAGELGLTRAALPKGLRYGAVTAVALGAAVAAAVKVGVDPTGAIGESAAVGGREMLFKVFVKIPIATVFFEELAFRGVVAGLFARVTSPMRALAWTSLAFGVWHVSPDQFTSLAGAGRALATIAATTGAGAAFLLLRRRSSSLAAPLLAHWGTNGMTFLVAWLTVRAIN